MFDSRVGRLPDAFEFLSFPTAAGLADEVLDIAEDGATQVAHSYFILRCLQSAQNNIQRYKDTVSVLTGVCI